MGLNSGYRILLTFSFLFFFSTVFAQANVPYIFEKEFKNCLKKNYSEKEFTRFYQVIDSLESSSVDVSAFKNYPVYTANINSLINSINLYQKGISYKLVATLHDKEFSALLTERLNGEDNKFLKKLNAAAMMRLTPKHTTPVFDYLVDNEDFSTSPLVPVYLQMDVKSIVKTAHARLNDNRPKAKVLALQTLARFDVTPEVDTIIIGAIKDWDIKIKGYAIVALGIHRKGNYKAILAPFFKHPELHEIILETLEHSITQEDVMYAEELRRKRK